MFVLQKQKFNTMIKLLIKTAFRNYLRNWNYPILNFAGLAIGLAIFIALSLFIQYEFGFDKFHSNADRIYRIEQLMLENESENLQVGCPAPLGPALKDQFPEIQAM